MARGSPWKLVSVASADRWTGDPPADAVGGHADGDAGGRGEDDVAGGRVEPGQADRRRLGRVQHWESVSRVRVAVQIGGDTGDGQVIQLHQLADAGGMEEAVA